MIDNHEIQYALIKFLLNTLHDNSLITDIKDDYPCPNNLPYSFPVVRAGITKCSTYAVVSRLKLFPTYTITVSGGTFAHPDYPQVTIIVPQKAVATETKFCLQLKVACLNQYDFHHYSSKSVCLREIIHDSRSGTTNMS